MLGSRLTVIDRIRNLDNIKNGTWVLLEEECKGSSIYIKDCFGICKITKDNLLKGICPSIKNAVDKSSYYSKKALQERGDKYDYSLVKYVNNSTKIEIVCKEHGSFFQTPKNHLQNKQECPQCQIKKGKYKYKMSFKEFKEKASMVHDRLYSYIDIEDDKSVSAVCKKHGEFKQNKYSHLQGHGCKKCWSENKSILYNHEYFLKQLFLKNNHYRDKKFEVISECMKRKSKVFVKDRYGVCEVSVSNLLEGASTSIVTAIDKVSYFKEQAFEKHGILYDYTYITEYKNNTDILPIGCTYHGIFNQKAMVHLSGSGCPKCNFNAFNYKEWEIMGQKSKNFESYKLYIVKLYNEDEEFYKVGKTYTNLTSRLRKIPYLFECIATYEMGAIEVCKLENKIHKLYYSYKYLPKKEFGGHQECFSMLPTKITQDIQKIIENEL